MISRAVSGVGARVTFAVLVSTIATAAPNWPGFRGDGTSVSGARGLPVKWSSTENIAWRIRLAGFGQSSPIIWNDRVYVTSVAGERKERVVVQAFNIRSGAEVWRFDAESSAPEKISNMRSQAAPTPAAAEDGVVAFFESGECFALDHHGRLRRSTNVSGIVPKAIGNHGLGGSPILFERGLFLPLDQAGPECLLALDRTTGALVWKAARPGKTSWSTPIAVRRGDEFLILISGGGTVAGYDSDSGALRFEVTGLVKNNVPSPSASKKLLVIGSGSKGSNLALDLDGGDGEPAQLWRSGSATSGFASPLIYNGRVYFVSSAGIVTCADAAAGKTYFEERIAESAWASPIGAEGRVFIFGEKGKTTILGAASTFEVLQTNELEVESNVTGVAVTDGAFIVRTSNGLVRIGADR